MAHTCAFGDPRCGRPSMFLSSYESLCTYCKRKAQLALAEQENNVLGQQERQRREARDAANEALGAFVAEHPVATIGGLLLGLGVAIGGSALAEDRKKSRDYHEGVKRKLKKR